MIGIGHTLTLGRGTKRPAVPTLPETGLVLAWTAEPEWCHSDGSGTLCGNGDPVERWYDRASNYWHEQQGVGAKPTFVLSDGKYWVQADGASTTMAMPAALDIGELDIGLTVYYRLQFTGTSADSWRFLHAHYSGEVDRWFFGKTDGSAALTTSLPGLSGYGSASRSGAEFSGNVETWRVSWSPGDRVELYRDGVLVNTESGVGSELTAIRGCLFGNGGTESSGGVQVWQGNLRHFAVYSGEHDPAAVEAFLAT